MTIINTEEKPGVWFEMEGGGRVQLRALGPADWRKILSATETQKPYLYEPINEDGSKGKPVMMTYEYTDKIKRVEMTNDATIVAFENLFDKNGKPIPCNYEQKTNLMSLEDPTFRDFVNEKIKTLQEAEADHVEQVSKNS